MATKVCPICNKEFSFRDIEKGRRIYCSRACKDESQRKHPKCPDCGKELAEMRSARCWDCAAKVRQTRLRKCQQCGKLCEDKRGHRGRFNMCRACAMKEWGKERVILFSAKKKAPIKTYGPGWDEQRNKALERANYLCENCKSINKPLDTHHKIPFRTFNYIPGENENYKQANDLSNLIVLCRKCHVCVENGIIVLSPP